MHCQPPARSRSSRSPSGSPNLGAHSGPAPTRRGPHAASQAFPPTRGGRCRTQTRGWRARCPGARLPGRTVLAVGQCLRVSPRRRPSGLLCPSMATLGEAFPRRHQPDEWPPRHSSKPRWLTPRQTAAGKGRYSAPLSNHDDDRSPMEADPPVALGRVEASGRAHPGCHPRGTGAESGPQGSATVVMEARWQPTTPSKGSC